MNGELVAKSDIVIVDDNPANLKLLQEMLALQGHRVRSFPLGRLALVGVAKTAPDLILMDVNMPEMDGYETCQRLKANPALADIPVIFLSALSETTDKVKAFHFGAADYITKPFQMEEVHSRVQTHLQLHNLQRALKRQNEQLEEAVAARTQELCEANARLRLLDKSKTEFLSLISHEFRTPLNGLFGVSEIILDRLDEEEDCELEQIYRRSRSRILEVLDDSMLLGQIDVGTVRFSKNAIALKPALDAALHQTRAFAKSREVAFTYSSETGIPPFEEDWVMGDAPLVARALQGLLETAVKFAKAGTSIRIGREATADGVTMLFESEGFTIPAAALEQFFDIFAIGEALTPGGDLGLRPAMAQRLLALFGARAEVANKGDIGVLLNISFRLPTEPRTQ